MYDELLSAFLMPLLALYLAAAFGHLNLQQCTAKGFLNIKVAFPAGAGVGAGIAGLEHGRHPTPGTHGSQSGYEGRQTGSGTGENALCVVHAQD